MLNLNEVKKLINEDIMELFFLVTEHKSDDIYAISGLIIRSRIQAYMIVLGISPLDFDLTNFDSLLVLQKRVKGLS